MGVEDGVGDDAFVDEGVAGYDIGSILCEIVVKDVVVGTVGDCAADVADGEGDGSDGSNKLVGTADLGDY